MIWQEPAKGGYPDRAFLGLSGIERVNAGRQGLIPNSPMSYLTELRLTEASRGYSTFTMPASPWFANSSGLISGALPGSQPDAPLRRPVEGEVLPQEQFERRTGLEILRLLIGGELPRPPIHHLTGLGLVDAAEGNILGILPCSKWLSTSAGTV